MCDKEACNISTMKVKQMFKGLVLGIPFICNSN